MKTARWMAMAAAVLACTTAHAQNAASTEAPPAKVVVNIEAQPIRGALQDFGKQTGIQVLFRSENVSVEGLTTPRVVGELSARAVLDRLLMNTGLKYEFVNEHTVRISSEHPVSGVKRSDELLGPKATPGSDPAEETKTRSGSAGASGSLEEIVVTAQKRIERLQDVPIPVTVINTEALVQQNQLRLQDYYASVPGLSLTSAGIGDAVLSIRGVTTSAYTNPTVGVVVDDVPFGSTTALGSRTSAPDIDPSDLARIEVLRGPQGTLYGANSMGGLLKFVTADPSTQALSGRVQADVSDIHNGDSVGYGVRGSVNLPLGETFAVQASGFTRRDPGYVNDPIFDRRGINEVDVDGGRVSALWHLSNSWSLKVSTIFQNTTADGASTVTVGPGLGDLEQVQALPLGRYSHRVSSYNSTLSGALGSINLISISGYSVDKYDALSDASNTYGAYSVPVFGVPTVQQNSHNETNKFTQEIRLSGSFRHDLDWLAGVFYTHEDTPTHDTYQSVDPATLAVVGLFFDDPYPTTYAEYAAFGDLTFHLTDKLDVQVGGRESQNRQRYEEIISGLGWASFGFPDPSINPPEHTKDNAFTYLVTPSYRASPDLMVYGRVASGYRPGGPNTTCILFSAPCHYQPDKTVNYEIGAKGDALNHLLSFDASVYYINWKDIQVHIFDPTTNAYYYLNASRAKSQGVELSVKARPLKGLSIGGWIAWNDAKLTSDLPLGSTAIGSSGDRLPYSSRFSGNASVEDEFPLTTRLIGFAGGMVSYVGSRESEFSSDPASPRQDLPGYAQADVRAGVRTDTWTIDLFVRNVADKRGLLAYIPSVNGVNYIQPRTVGLSLSRSFSK